MVIAKLLILSFFIASLFIISCDLFTGPKVDLFKVISDEVDWSKAAKLTVRVEHPAAWGISNPTGNITPAKDIRKGYAFEIEFTPDLAWSLDGWRAYKTSSLPDNWQFDTGLLDNVERLDGASVIVPELPARGGTGSFTINTTENVTLVPWCKTEPYILRTVPRDSPTTVYPRGTAIEIFFNAPLLLPENEELERLFISETIKITAKDKITDEAVLISNNNYSYNYPVYTVNNDLGEYKITITPTNVPGNSVIEVTVGPLIFNASNTPMAKAEVFSFATPSADADGRIKTWDAAYTGKTIIVNWETEAIGTTEPEAVYVEAHYRLNKGTDNPLPGVSSGPIKVVGELDDSSVREGVSVNGIQEYEVFLDLIVEGLKSNVRSVTFKIWNIPGMKVAHNNPIIEITTEADLAAIRTPAQNNPYYGLGVDNAARQYVLANDIAVSTWTPIGTAPPSNGADTNSFQGKFYGNGHTVSINGFAVPNGVNADMGLFGVVGGGFIRDLTVQYSGGISRSGETRFGGIAGTMSGTAKMENVLVKGDVSVTVVSDNYLYVGGIAGRMLGDAQITNAYGGLNLTVDHPNANSILLEGSSVMVGGITGSIGIPPQEGPSADAKINETTVEGNITVDAAATIVDPDNDDQVGLIVGGIIGFMKSKSSAELNNSCYRRGSIKIIPKNGSPYLGGVVGYIYDGKINNCYSTSGYFNIEKTNSGLLTVGGFFGYLEYGGIIKNCYSNVILIISSQNNGVYAGGFGGISHNNIDYCYTNGSVTVTCGTGRVGGFLGDGGGNINNCYALGDVKVTCDYGISAGGLSGTFTFGMNGKIENCYALGNVDVDVKNTRNNIDVFVGGLVGDFQGGVNNSFSTGTVNVKSIIQIDDADSAYGGFLGKMDNTSNVQNNAVLCKSVTKTSNTNIGRVYGSGANSSAAYKNNHAYSGMLVNGSTVGSGAHNNKDGENVTFENFHFQDFWRNAPSDPPTSTSGLGFDPTHWIFTTVGNYGYPILKASDGTEMGGQR